MRAAATIDAWRSARARKSAMRAKAGPALTALVERIGCPAVVSPKAKGVLAKNHAYFAGTLDMACNACILDLLASADLVKLAESMDCHSARVESQHALEAALGDATALDRPLVIEARIDPAQ